MNSQNNLIKLYIKIININSIFLKVSKHFTQYFKSYNFKNQSLF
jgi:hypothetical protein